MSQTLVIVCYFFPLFPSLVSIIINTTFIIFDDFFPLVKLYYYHQDVPQLEGHKLQFTQAAVYIC